MNPAGSVRDALGLSLLIFMFALAPGCCDMVTTTDNLSIYGTIVEITTTLVKLEAKFSSGTKSYPIPRDKVIRIDLNSTTYNPSAPPRTMGLESGDAEDGHPAQPSPGDVVVLRGNISKPCKLIGIDATAVHCEGGDYPRSRALYILLGHDQ